MKSSRRFLPLEAASEEAIAWNGGEIDLAESRPAALWLDEIRRACGAFEWVTFTYLAWLLAILTIFHRNIPHATPYLALHLSIAAEIAWLVWFAAHSRNAVVRFARHWYPLPLYIFLFEELQGLVHAIFPGWFDRWLIAFDYSLARAHPSVWLAQFASPALNDFMQFSYMTYFLYLIILPMILYARREQLAFWTVMTSTAVAHYSVYVVSVLLPIESPHYSLAPIQTKTLAGGYCTALIELIERFGRVHGAAFPSAHVAGSMVAILASWSYRRWLFWVCLPFFASMCVATVYGRYHYVADVLAGLVVGAMGFSVGTYLVRRSGALPEFEA
ncbi:MAG TPA: phosphatase PAP2 family protein [Candidatus Acidoferrales bacterium]|nr:phosphatase PAP2 family protein [Candidatus Acidoferrales bacterium]